MKTKILYSVVTDEKDFYLEQLLMSLYSLRIKNPSAHVTLVVDSQTNSSLVSGREKVKDYVDDLVSIDTPAGLNKKQRSRWLKTSIRNIVDGDYLFIDSDTVIADSLEDIDNCEYDFAAVLDRHLPVSLHPKRASLLEQFEFAGITPRFDDDSYFNSGVMLVKDTLANRKLYSLWFEGWNSSRVKKIDIDQPALANANSEQGFIIKQLGGEWNCQICGNGLRFLQKAKIIHYYNSNSRRDYTSNPYLFSNDVLYKEIRNNKYIIPSAILDMIKDPKSQFAQRYDILSDDLYEAFNSPFINELFLHYARHDREYKILSKYLSLRKKLRKLIKS